MLYSIVSSLVLIPKSFVIIAWISFHARLNLNEQRTSRCFHCWKWVWRKNGVDRPTFQFYTESWGLHPIPLFIDRLSVFMLITTLVFLLSTVFFHISLPLAYFSWLHVLSYSYSSQQLIHTPDHSFHSRVSPLCHLLPSWPADDSPTHICWTLISVTHYLS